MEHNDFKPYVAEFMETILFQEVLWTNISDKTKFEIELIMPTLAVCHPYSTGHYVHFLARTTKEINLGEIHVAKEVYVRLQMPLGTWNKAMRCVPYQIKKQWISMKEKPDNIWFEGEKFTKNHLKITNIERRVPHFDDKDKAVKFYEEEKEFLAEDQ